MIGLRQVAGLAVELPHLLHVGVPAAGLGEGHFQADVGLDEDGDLPQGVAERRLRIVRAVGRLVALDLGGGEHVDGAEGLAAGVAQQPLGGLPVERLEALAAAAAVRSAPGSSTRKSARLVTASAGSVP